MLHIHSVGNPPLRNVNSFQITRAIASFLRPLARRRSGSPVVSPSAVSPLRNPVFPIRCRRCACASPLLGQLLDRSEHHLGTLPRRTPTKEPECQ